MYITTITPVVDTVALAAGDVSSNKFSIPFTTKKGRIENLLVIDKSDTGKAFDILLFDNDYTAMTVNSPVNVSGALSAGLVGSLRVAASDFIDFGAIRLATLRNINLNYRGSVGGTLYAQLVAVDAVTYLTAGDIILKFATQELPE